MRLGQLEYAVEEREQEVEIVHQLHEQRLRTIEARLDTWKYRPEGASDHRQQI